MSAQVEKKYLPFDPNPKEPDFPPPTGACDTQIHVSGVGYKKREGATYESVGATPAAGRRMHQKLGLERGVIVQSSVYGTDNTILLDSLQELGSNYRGVALIDDNTTDAEMGKLHDAGVRGIRFHFAKKINMAPDPKLLLRSAARAKEMGWVVKFGPPDEGMAPLMPFVEKLKGQPVIIDHMAKVRDADAPDCKVVCDLLRAGNLHIMMSNGLLFNNGPNSAGTIAAGRKFVEANVDNLIWGSDWPHPFREDYMPNDGDALNLVYRYADNDMGVIKNILVDNPARLFDY